MCAKIYRVPYDETCPHPPPCPPTRPGRFAGVPPIERGIINPFFSPDSVSYRYGVGLAADEEDSKAPRSPASAPLTNRTYAASTVPVAKYAASTVPVAKHPGYLEVCVHATTMEMLLDDFYTCTA